MKHLLLELWLENPAPADVIPIQYTSGNISACKTINYQCIKCVSLEKFN